MKIVFFLLPSLLSIFSFAANVEGDKYTKRQYIDHTLPNDLMRVILCKQKKDIRFVCKNWNECFLFSGVSLSMSLSKLLRFNKYCNEYKENEFINNIENIYIEPMLLKNTKSLQSWQNKKVALDDHFQYLSKLPKLKQYIIYWNDQNTIKDGYMKNFVHPKLISLEVHFQNLEDLNFIVNLPSLKTLELCGTSFKEQDDKHFFGLTNLLSLKLSSCNVNNFSFLSFLVNLNKLHLNDVSSDNQYYDQEDINYISFLTNLRSLNLSKSNFTDSILIDIEKLTTLERLTVKCTLIDDEKLESLTTKLNQLTITNEGNTDTSSSMEE